MKAVYALAVLLIATLLLTYIPSWNGETNVTKNANLPGDFLLRGNHTVYYVSPDSTSTDWDAARNITTPCTPQTAMQNAMPGDVVLFRGGFYNFAPDSSGSAVLEPAHSGEPGNPIIFMAYPGETPILNGNIVVKVEGIADAGSNDTYLVDNDVNFTQAGVQTWDIVRTEDKPGGAPVDHVVDAHTIQLITEEVHNSINLTAGDRYTIGMDIVTVLSNGYNSHIIFDGFVIEANNGTEMARLLVRGLDANNFVENITVRNCTIISGKRMIVHGTNREGLRIEDTYNTTVQNCTIYGQRQINGWHNTGAIKMYHNRNTTIEHCEIYDTTLAIFDKSDSYHSVFRYNYIHDVDRGILFTGYAWNTSGQYFVSSHRNAEIYDNVITYTKHGAISDIEQEWSDSDGMKVYKNTIYTGSNQSLSTGIGLSGGRKEVYDNIIYGRPKDYDVGILRFITGNYENGTYYPLEIMGSDHNLFPDIEGSFCVRTVKPDPNNSSDLVYLTYWNLTQWQNSGELYNGDNPGNGSIVAKPIFMNISGTMHVLEDFKLANNSPAKGAGRHGEDMGADIEMVGVMKKKHEPLRINSNTELVNMAISEHWIGDGSYENPYIIANYDIIGSSGYGIYVGNVTLHFVMRGNYIHDTTLQSEPYYCGAAVIVYNSTNGTMYENRFWDNYEGIRIIGSHSNEITGNIIENSTSYGIWIQSGTGNVIYNNSFYYNHGSTGIYSNHTVQARDDGSGNSWNSSLAGNFWYDWRTPDSNEDGIVDNPYPIDGNSGARDYLPLASSPTVPEIHIAFILIAFVGLALFTWGRKRRNGYGS